MEDRQTLNRTKFSRPGAQDLCNLALKVKRGTYLKIKLFKFFFFFKLLILQSHYLKLRKSGCVRIHPTVRYNKLRY